MIGIGNNILMKNNIIIPSIDITGAVEDYNTGSTYPTPAGADGGKVALTFNNDGTKVYILWNYNGISEYILSTPYDLRTYTLNYTFVGSNLENPRKMIFNSDGTKAFVAYRLSSNNVKEFTFSTPYLLSSATVTTTKSLDAIYIEDLSVSEDGLKLYALSNQRILYQYTLSTSFLLSSINLTANYTVSLTSMGNPVLTASIHDNGKIMLIGGNTYEIARQYDLTTPFDARTYSLFGTFNTSLSTSGTSNDYAFNNDYSKWYVVAGNGIIKVYNL